MTPEKQVDQKEQYRIDHFKKVQAFYEEWDKVCDPKLNQDQKVAVKRLVDQIIVMGTVIGRVYKMLSFIDTKDIDKG